MNGEHCAALLLCMALCTAQVNARRPTYLLFTRPPGVRWSQDKPDTLNTQLLNEVKDGLGCAAIHSDSSLLVGNEIIFSVFQTPLSTLLRSVRNLLDAALEARVPVSVVLDGQNWWSASGLWNWWNSSLPGYAPSNVANVEWTRPGDPSSAVKIGWRNWGSQIRVTPEQNILGEGVWKALTPILSAVARQIASWWHSLPEDCKYLLATVKVGWEAGLQYNAYYYTNGNSLVNKPPAHDPTTGLNFSKGGLGAGLPVLGYAAAHSAGIRLKPGQQLTREQAAHLASLYVGKLASVVVAAGVPSALLSNHVGGQNPPYTAVPFSAAFVAANQSYSPCVPGWSFYWTVPSKVAPLLQAMQSAGRTRWAAAEWYLPSSTVAGWYNNFAQTLCLLNCTHLAVYNWDNMFEKSAVGKAAVCQLLEQWGSVGKPRVCHG